MMFIKSPSVDPYFNLALEEYVFDSMDKNEDYFILWQNERTVVVGKHQNTVQEIDLQYAKENGIAVVRRLSGGGAVYQDTGNLNFTFIVTDAEEEDFNFEMFCRPITDILESLEIRGEINGRNDITINGRKFSGNSQYTKQNSIMHHGTLLFDTDLDMLERVLRPSEDKITSKGAESVRSRVTNIKEHLKEEMTMAEFEEHIIKFLSAKTNMERHILTPEEIAEVKGISRGKYETWEWNYGASPRYELHKKRRIEGCGSFEIYMSVNEGKISGFDIFGDYFGNGDKRELEELLLGKKCNREGLEETLSDIPIARYINKMTKEKFAELLLE